MIRIKHELLEQRNIHEAKIKENLEKKKKEEEILLKEEKKKKEKYEKHVVQTKNTAIVYKEKKNEVDKIKAFKEKVIKKWKFSLICSLSKKSFRKKKFLKKRSF